MGRAAYPTRISTYQRPREKKPSSASTTMMIRMIQRMLSAVTSFVASGKQHYNARKTTTVTLACGFHCAR